MDTYGIYPSYSPISMHRFHPLSSWIGMHPEVKKKRIVLQKPFFRLAKCSEMSNNKLCVGILAGPGKKWLWTYFDQVKTHKTLSMIVYDSMILWRAAGLASAPQHHICQGCSRIHLRHGGQQASARQHHTNTSQRRRQVSRHALMGLGD